MVHELSTQSRRLHQYPNNTQDFKVGEAFGRVSTRAEHELVTEMFPQLLLEKNHELPLQEDLYCCGIGMVVCTMRFANMVCANPGLCRKTFLRSEMPVTQSQRSGGGVVCRLPQGVLPLDHRGKGGAYLQNIRR